MMWYLVKHRDFTVTLRKYVVRMVGRIVYQKVF